MVVNYLDDDKIRIIKKRIKKINVFSLINKLSYFKEFNRNKCK